MTISVLLDTGFLISLVDRNRPNHKTAGQYYKFLVEQRSAIYLSAIVASEFAIKQPITDLPLKNFRILPFNITHSIESARLSNLLGPKDAGDNRAVVREDVKIMAQASHENIQFILTEDGSTLFKYCERLQKARNFNVRAIKLADGFDPSLLRIDGQKSIFSVTDEED
ncbi:PIN domain-containing protein [Methylomonas sp. OY6]|uniref:PIN domain-containing protein n=1 Tax=Methylomonas defluvii TaxID=3045149 RepID=A0ABU4UHQ1_9GAMM|nr:PIN domain-containing protein [Methylomonas sp. OY6]MDX8129002.1 PIN domain-containing protein [Methylomonas sp. OY6]